MLQNEDGFILPSGFPDTPTRALIVRVCLYPCDHGRGSEVEVLFRDWGKKRLTKTDLRFLTEVLGTNMPHRWIGKEVFMRRMKGRINGKMLTWVGVVPMPVPFPMPRMPSARGDHVV